ncbi:MAG: hypothetical protein ACE5GS_17165 [Kiloniellaceae bacterium]
MSEDKNEGGRAAELWRLARPGWLDAVAAAEAPDPMVLAAYLDGNLDPDARARVEAWMAASPAGLDLVAAAREAREAAAPAVVPDRVLRRASALVRAGSASGARAGDWRARMASALAAWARSTAWAGVAAAILLASLSGFELGRTGVEHLASLDALMADDVRLVMGRPTPDLL